MNIKHITTSIGLCCATTLLLAQPARVNIMPSYTMTGNNMTIEQIGSVPQQVIVPRDLAFSLEGDLWVVNQGTENSGGSTVTFYNPGEANQTSLWRQDGNAWHFMSLPSGIAFGDNGNFATSPSVYDANHDGGIPFTGPSLWSSDSLIYAQPSGGNGSHMDMLHASPVAMGIAHERENVYWVFDSESKDVVRYDFAMDHGPGGANHDDGRIRRFKGQTVDKFTAAISCHLALDEAKQWLYVVDGGSNTIFRLDITTGTLGGNPSFGPYETLAEYRDVVGATWETVATGLNRPSGVDVIGSTLIVSEFVGGDIILFDISSLPATEIGRIATGASGVQGIEIGPNGRIWFVNSSQNHVSKIEPETVLVSSQEDIVETRVTMYPNPTSGDVQLRLELVQDEAVVQVANATGQIVYHAVVEPASQHQLSIDPLPAGMYVVSVRSEAFEQSQTLVVTK